MNFYQLFWATYTSSRSDVFSCYIFHFLCGMDDYVNISLILWDAEKKIGFAVGLLEADSVF